MQPKFKPGMKVWSVRHGVVELEGAPNSFVSDGECEYYSADGKLIRTDKYPSLYTLEEARKMGFPVPEEPMTVWLTFDGSPIYLRNIYFTEEEAKKDHTAKARKFVGVKE